MLRLQAESPMPAVNDPVFAGYRPIQEISRIKLNTRLGCYYSKFPACHEFGNDSGCMQFARLAGQNIIVVITAFHASDPFTDGMVTGREIHWGTGYGRQLAGRDQLVIHLGIPVSINHHVMIQDIACAAVKVEIRMIAEIDRSRLVGFRPDIDHQLVLVIQRIFYRYLQVPGISFLAILAEIGQRDASFSISGEFGSIPYHLVKTFISPVKGVIPVILSQVVGFAVQRKGSDGGFVFPCALQYGTYLAARKTTDGLIRMASMNFPGELSVPVSKPLEKQGDKWFNYPLGVLAQFMKKGLVLHGMELLFTGDIPNGSGLSSSASIEMVTAVMVNDFLSAGLDMIELVKMSQNAEHEFAGVNCGIMDQFAVGMGEKNHAVFLNCHTLEYKLVPVLMPGYALIVANTNKKRGLADSKYNERVAECQEAVKILSPHFGIDRLGEVSFMQFYKSQDVIQDPVIRKRARHVISEDQRVLNAVSCLLKSDLIEFGALMNASHESLRDNYEVTGPELDALVEEAQKVNGTIGSRMTGAGFGGCTVSIVKEEAVNEFMEKVGEGYRQRTGLEPTFYIGEIGDGARKIK